MSEYASLITDMERGINSRLEAIDALRDLESLIDGLIEWIQEDCPFNREDILEIARKHVKERGE